MELLTILLSGFFSIVGSGGWVLDLLADNNLSSRLSRVQNLTTRVDNIPGYQIIKGKVTKIRIASRGLELEPKLRIDTLELETDPINLDWDYLNSSRESLSTQKNFSRLRESLNQPLQGAVRLVITETDINSALQSKNIQQKLQESLNSLLKSKTGSSAFSYTLIAPRIQLLPNNRLRVNAKLERAGTRSNNLQSLTLKLEWGLKVVAGKNIQLVKPIGTVNGKPLSTRLLQGFAEGISNRLDLNTLEKTGIIARLLQLEVDEEQIRLAAFVRVETKQAAFSPKSSKLD
jgi:hypothetical protein